ncbi:hypothetical protein TNCV_486651 [Trichonephila clavipes]|nr:hypothetical protein TNCV_486651 [Trichonephila clavipes]
MEDVVMNEQRVVGGEDYCKLDTFLILVDITYSILLTGRSCKLSKLIQYLTYSVSTSQEANPMAQNKNKETTTLRNAAAYMMKDTGRKKKTGLGIYTQRDIT